MNRRTQQYRIMRYLETHKYVTTMIGFEELRIPKLTTRISELRAKGVNIKDYWYEDTNSRYKRYYL